MGYGKLQLQEIYQVHGYVTNLRGTAWRTHGESKQAFHWYLPEASYKQNEQEEWQLKNYSSSSSSPEPSLCAATASCLVTTNSSSESSSSVWVTSYCAPLSCDYSMVSMENAGGKKEGRTYNFGPNARQDLNSTVQSSKLRDDLNSFRLLGPTRLLPLERFQTPREGRLSAL